MKFTKEQFSEALKTKLTANGKKLSESEQTFSKNVERIYKRLEKHESEDELNDVVTDYLPDFEEIEGQLRHDKSEFIKEWEKKNPKPKEEPHNETQTETQRLEAMQKQIQELLDKQKATETAQSVAAKKSAIISSLKEKNVTDADWVNAQMELISISADTDVEATTSKVLGLYNKLNAGGGDHNTPKGAGGGTPDKPDFSDIVAKVKQSRGEVN